MGGRLIFLAGVTTVGCWEEEALGGEVSAGLEALRISAAWTMGAGCAAGLVVVGDG